MGTKSNQGSPSTQTMNTGPWAAQQPLQPKRVQRPLDVGFWDPMRNQLEMF